MFLLIQTRMVDLHEDAAQGLAVLGEGTLLAVTNRLGDNLIVRPETFLRGHHCFQMVVQLIPLPISVCFIVYPVKLFYGGFINSLDSLLQPLLPPH